MPQCYHIPKPSRILFARLLQSARQPDEWKYVKLRCGIIYAALPKKNALISIHKLISLLTVPKSQLINYINIDYLNNSNNLLHAPRLTIAKAQRIEDYKLKL